MPNPDDPLHTFRAWSLVHFIVIVAAVVIGLALAALRRRWRETPAAQRLDRTLAALTAAAWLITQLLSLFLADSPVASALPLHVSDLTTLAIPIALWTCARSLRAIVYYWGLTLGSLAFVLPDLGDGPAQLGFWVFWLPHIIITGAVLYELVGRDYRPRWRDLGFATVASLAYSALIIPFNAATGFGYGYLGPDQPNQPPAIAYFGTWPVRCILIFLTGVASMALLTLPWLFSTGRAAARERSFPAAHKTVGE